MLPKTSNRIRVNFLLVLHLFPKTLNMLVFLSQHLLLLVEKVLQGLDSLVGRICHFLDVPLLLDAYSGLILIHLILKHVVLTEILVAETPLVHGVDLRLLLH